MKNQKIEDYKNTQKSKISQLKDLGIYIEQLLRAQQTVLEGKLNTRITIYYI
jgi:hypothetical protein